MTRLLATRTIDPLSHFVAARHVMMFYFLDGNHVALIHAKIQMALSTNVGLAVADANASSSAPFFFSCVVMAGQGQYPVLIFPFLSISTNAPNHFLEPRRINSSSFFPLKTMDRCYAVSSQSRSPLVPPFHRISLQLKIFLGHLPQLGTQSWLFTLPHKLHVQARGEHIHDG